MKCRYCNYETTALNDNDALVELDKHFDQNHTEDTIPNELTVRIMEMSLEYEKEIETVVNLFYKTKKLISEHYNDGIIKKDELAIWDS